jgi:arylsulfatase B
MTGQYPFHTGLQHDVIGSQQAVGVPLHLSMLPQVLQKEAGYATHMVGKWHLGFCNWQYAPTRRGFQSFTGYLTGVQDYYTRVMTGDRYSGYDFRENETLSFAENGTYTTFTFTQRAVDLIAKHDVQQPLFLYLPFPNVHSPLQVPSQYSDLYKHIEDPDRRTYCGLATNLDEAVGNITNALKARGMFDNTIIIFTTDVS